MHTLYGAFLQFPLLGILGSLGIILTLGYLGARLILWTAALAILLVGLGAPIWLLATFGLLALLFNTTPLRRSLITSAIMKAMKGFMPKISATERTALEAGVVWIEKDLFGGKPDFKKMLGEPYAKLSDEEKAFMNGPVEELCKSVDDWKVWQEKELPKAAWDIMKKYRFFGMGIPKQFGGLEFSAMAHSEVIMKLSTRCVPVCITAMVPNSLGPAELIHHYGTDEQKKTLLPKLATGEEIPAFALTEPTAGSDAGSLLSTGILFKENGKLFIRLNWNKRYITLAAIATTLGLAFRLKDPENLLGKGEDVGITCGLIPTQTKGVVIGRRHDPLGVPFYNCPTQGHDVVVSTDCIVGGIEGAGLGWKMLMECLAAGRGISLPAQSTGGLKLVTRVTSNHATIRRQFGVSVGKFEGIEAPLAHITAFGYILEAMRRLTCGAIDKGIKPPVITAIAKYWSTEMCRIAVNHGMDICGGQAISRGPRNLLAHAYIGTPIGITVEGANIMTRTLIIFGQGAMRAHPYAYKEVVAIEKNDLMAFDEAFWGHIGHVVRNTFRAVLLSLTRGYLARTPVDGKIGRYYQKLAWSSASFAILADIAMGTLGGTLKLREKITGRFADILSWMYLGYGVLHRFEAEGRKKEDLPLVHYSMQFAFSQIQEAFDGILQNLKVPGLGWLFNGIIRTWSHVNSLGEKANDRLSHKIATLIQTDGAQRDRLTDGIFIPKDPKEALGRLEAAFKAVKHAEVTEAKIHKAIKAKKLPKLKGIKLIEEAFKAGIISEVEVSNLKRAQELRDDAIQVDDFTQEEFLGREVSPVNSVAASA